MNQHFLQSEAWEKFQTDLKRKAVRKHTNYGDFFGIIERGRFNSRLYIPYGPQVQSADNLIKLLEIIKQSAKQQKVDFIRIEPLGNIDTAILKKAGYRKAKDVQPSHTIINTLTDDETIQSLTSQTVRRMWRKNLKAGVTFQASYDPQDIEIFINMIHDVAKRTGMVPHSDTYFRQMASSLFPTKQAGIFYAIYENKPVASILFFSNGETMYYGHAGSYSEYRKLSPATALGLEMLRYAHQTGHKFFDFYGIAPEDAPKTNPWYGFTQFKKSFGGRPTEFPGTWELPLRPITYNLYHLYQKIYQTIRHHS